MSSSPAARWPDARGENLLVLSREDHPAKGPNGAVELTAVHAVRTEQGWHTARRVWDASGACAAESHAHFARHLLKVSHLDADGVGEVTFAYSLRCRAGEEPAPFKLLLLDAGDKYILRGASKVWGTSGVSRGGEASVDPAFADGPKALLKRARARWNTYVAYAQDED